MRWLASWRAWLCACLLGSVTPVHATVINSLPYTGTPDWTDITFVGTSMTASASQSVLTTGYIAGVWFGWGASYGNTPAWTPGTSAQGNHLSISGSFSAGSKDWHAYLYDGSHLAEIEWNPTGCGAGDCYSVAPQNGVKVWHAGATPETASNTFVPLDVTQAHTYEFLLRNGQVSYRIDGSVVYSGAAFATPFSGALLVIGDGSGSTLTGAGSMTITSVSFDTAPSAQVLVSSVPEPETTALWMVGVAVAMLAARRRSTPSRAAA